MAVPYTFGSATSSIPLSQLDSNFATTITLGNTAIQLGNTVTTLNNMTLANVTVSSGNVTVTSVTDSGLTAGRVNYNGTGGLLVDSANLTFDGTTLTANKLTSTNDASISGLTVGKGAGALDNTVVGRAALAGGSQSGTNLSALGVGSLNANSSGGNNTAIGASALQNNTTASNNTAIGYNAGFNNTTGGSNTAIGVQALVSNTTASNNTAVGYQAGYSNTTGQNNYYAGYQAGYSNNTDNNTIVGAGAGYSTTGRANTFIGRNDNGFGAGNQITTGYKNTIIGGFAGNQGGLDIRTANNYIVLSDGDGNPRQIVNNTGSVGIGVTPDANFYLTVQSTSDDSKNAIKVNQASTATRTQVSFNNPNGQVGTIQTVGSATAYNTSSDYRLKENITPMTGALAKVAQLKPVTYKWKIDGADGEGFIAHELAEVCSHAVSGEKDAVDAGGNPIYQGIDVSFLVATLTAAIQELKTIVDAQAAEIAELKAK